MADGAHAKFSPSSAHRWGECPGAMVLEREYPDTSSAFADEGTAAHEVASRVLLAGPDAMAAHYIGERIDVSDSKTVECTDDMASFVQLYVDFVREAARDGSMLVEQKVCFEQTLQLEPGEGFGTADALIVTGSHLTVVDLKFGRGERVEAEENHQMMMYALGAIETFGDLFGPFETFSLVIHQPRIVAGVSVWHTDLARLEEFADSIRTEARRVKSALRIADEGKPIDAYLSPGEKTCRWCKAKATCPALAYKVQEQIGVEFADLTAEDTDARQLVQVVDSYGDNALPMAMAAVGLIEDWCTAVRAETERRLLAGKPVQGWKLVEGRKGSRAWTDPKAAEDLLKGKFRLPVDDMYEKTLISPTQATKLLKTSPQRLAQVEALISQKAGKPSVAPESDKRPAYQPMTFDDVSVEDMT